MSRQKLIFAGHGDPALGPAGYQNCACRDCFEPPVGHPGVFCFECFEAGCHKQHGLPNMPCLVEPELEEEVGNADI